MKRSEQKDLRKILSRAPDQQRHLPDFLSRQKTQMYAKVSEFFRNAHEVSVHDEFHVCSLPADTWRFEQAYFRETKHLPAKVMFTGFEKNSDAFDRGIRNAPWAAYEHPVTSSMQKFEALNMEYFKTNRSRYLCMNIHDAVCATPKLFRPSLVATKPSARECCSEFFATFTAWDAVWLDFNGCLSESMMRILSNIGRCIRTGNEIIPVVVTVAKGREDRPVMSALRGMPDRSQARQQLIEQLLDVRKDYQFCLYNSWEYVRDGGKVQMLNVFGYYEKLQH